jgi:hypothetical protein
MPLCHVDQGNLKILTFFDTNQQDVRMQERKLRSQIAVEL